MAGVPELELTDPRVLTDPFTSYGRAREQSPLARLQGPGFGPIWVLTRHEGARAMLADQRFELRAESYQRLDVPEDCRPYLRTMSEQPGPEHARLRQLVAPAFSARRAAGLADRIEPLVDRLLDELPDHVEDGTVDLVEHVLRPLPMDVICELVGIPWADRPRWREFGVMVASGAGQQFAEAVPGIVHGARDAVARRRADPDVPDLLGDLVRAQAEDGDRLDDTELITMVWHLVLAGQTPANLIANAVAELFAHPKQLAALRAEPTVPQSAVDELVRWCGPTLLTIPRYATQDVELYGSTIGQGDAVTAAVAAVNRDPRAFADPDRFDVGRTGAPSAHLGFGHGPHFCLGAALARTETTIALARLWDRFPDLAPAYAPDTPDRAFDPGTWRLNSLRVELGVESRG